MHESASRRLETLVTLDADLEREFEDRLRESSSLAVRVAYSVVRQRQDAEEVAQEAFAKAYSRFSQLRDRNSFRAWLVRMTWRLAIDRWRSDRRRTAREQSAMLEAPARRRKGSPRRTREPNGCGAPSTIFPTSFARRSSCRRFKATTCVKWRNSSACRKGP